MRKQRKKLKGSLPREFVALLERARRNETAAPRKHHLVPASYLRRWAESGRLRVTEVETSRSFHTSPEKAARVTDFYRLEAVGVDPGDVPPLLFETMLSDVERWGKSVIDELIGGAATLDPRRAAEFAWYLAFQITRGRAHRSELRWLANEAFKLQYCDLTDDQIRRKLRRSGREPDDTDIADTRRFLAQLRDGSLVVTPQDAQLSGLAAEAAAKLGEHLLSRAWIVCETRRVLLTCDEPVVPVGGPGLPRDERAGIGTAGVLLFPLDPGHLLVMMHGDLALSHGISSHRHGVILRDELDHIETIEVCHEIAMSAHRWAFERPHRRLAASFPVPSAPVPGQLEEVGPFSRGDQKGELLRFYRPNRWRSADLTPQWPVDRWWRS